MLECQLNSARDENANETENEAPVVRLTLMAIETGLGIVLGIESGLVTVTAEMILIRRVVTGLNVAVTAFDSAELAHY